MFCTPAYPRPVHCARLPPLVRLRAVEESGVAGTPAGGSPEAESVMDEWAADGVTLAAVRFTFRIRFMVAMGWAMVSTAFTRATIPAFTIPHRERMIQF